MLEEVKKSPALLQCTVPHWAHDHVGTFGSFEMGNWSEKCKNGWRFPPCGWRAHIHFHGECTSVLWSCMFPNAANNLPWSGLPLFYAKTSLVKSLGSFISWAKRASRRGVGDWDGWIAAIKSNIDWQQQVNSTSLVTSLCYNYCFESCLRKKMSNLEI